MKIKTFNITEEDKVNEFISTAVLMDEGAVQVTGENTIVVFYRDTKENYQKGFVEEMIDGLKRNHFHETVRLVALESDHHKATDKGTSYPEYDELTKKKKDAKENIARFEAKIEALETWSKKNI